MAQQIFVAVIVVIAFAASVWKLAPARQRLRALLALDGWVARHPRLAGWRERRLKRRRVRDAKQQAHDPLDHGEVRCFEADHRGAGEWDRRSRGALPVQCPHVTSRSS